MVTLAKRSMTDAQLSRRKKVQGHATQVTSAGGLTALGLLGASTLARRKGHIILPRKAANEAQRAGQLRLRRASQNVAIGTSGLSGVAGFNSASISAEEARRKPSPVKGSLVKRGERTAAAVTSTITRLGEKVAGPRHTRFKLRSKAGGAVKYLALDPRPLASASVHGAMALAKSAHTSDTSGHGVPVVTNISAARAVRTANRLQGNPERAKRLAAHLAKKPTSSSNTVGQHLAYYKAVAGNRDTRLVRPTVDRWSRTYKGVSQIKNADPRGRQDLHEIVHNPVRARAVADSRIIRTLARSSPKSDRPLHRVTFVRVGTKEPVGHRTPSSWTPDERIARKVADYQSTRNRRNAAAARKTKLIPKVSRTYQRRIIPGELHIVTKPEGMRAMNMSAATPRFRQSERVAVTHVRMNHAQPLSKKKDQGWVLKPRKQFDSEASRDRREKTYGRALAAGSGAAAGGAGYQAAQAGRKAAQGVVLRRRATNQVKRAEGAESFARQARGVSGDILRRKKGEASARHLYDQAAHGAEKHAAVARTLAMRSSEKAPVALRAAGAHGLKGAALAGGALALAGGAKAVSTHRQHGGKTYNGWWEHRY